ncbi:hypothetical protein N7462_007845 [Penicillium macrosclerotiorum]|uniref:uncharacterized protein n=1 Tax=Penicillium macrosclerotiorum TaxID=303699 RepID=UPI002549BAF2|nr:uncharacterized protein N7462_007845 [Penicillium macrosclerotiorum]KAJ5679601.1 hypothetical protein N7462_007845 [Penicillium macrosclerotiorum]
MDSAKDTSTSPTIEGENRFSSNSEVRESTFDCEEVDTRPVMINYDQILDTWFHSTLKAFIVTDLNLPWESHNSMKAAGWQMMDGEDHYMIMTCLNPEREPGTADIHKASERFGSHALQNLLTLRSNVFSPNVPPTECLQKPGQVDGVAEKIPDYAKNTQSSGGMEVPADKTPKENATPETSTVEKIAASPAKKGGYKRMEGKGENDLPENLRNLSPPGKRGLKLTDKQILELIPFTARIRKQFSQHWTQEGYLKKAYQPLLNSTRMQDGNEVPMFPPIIQKSNCRNWEVTKEIATREHLFNKRGEIRKRQPKSRKDSHDAEGKFTKCAKEQGQSSEKGKLDSVISILDEMKSMRATSGSKLKKGAQLISEMTDVAKQRIQDQEAFVKMNRDRTAKMERIRSRRDVAVNLYHRTLEDLNKMRETAGQDKVPPEELSEDTDTDAVRKPRKKKPRVTAPSAEGSSTSAKDKGRLSTTLPAGGERKLKMPNNEKDANIGQIDGGS